MATKLDQFGWPERPGDKSPCRCPACEAGVPVVKRYRLEVKHNGTEGYMWVTKQEMEKIRALEPAMGTRDLSDHPIVSEAQ
jgi:hypothetical protein